MYGSGTARLSCILGALCAVLTPRSYAIVVSTVDELVAAVGEANAGGDPLIELEDGTYTLDNLLWISADGITVRGLSGNRDAVIVEGRGMWGHVTHIFGVDGSHFTVQDMTLRSVSNHAVQLMLDLDYTTIRNVHILDTFEQMIKVPYDPSDLGRSSDNGIVENCLLEYSAGVGPQWYIGGVDAHNAKNWIVRDNVFIDIRSPSDALAEHAVHFWTGSENTLVEGNLIINCDRGIGFGLGDRGHIGGVIRNNMIYHDTSEGFADVGIGLESAPGARVYNNTIYHEHTYPNAIEYRFPATTDVLIANNLTNRAITSRDGASAALTHNLTDAVSGWFVNPAAGDLHLAYEVPAVVDQGTDIDGLTDDFDGDHRPRGQGIDIGADEYSSGVGVENGGDMPASPKMRLYQDQNYPNPFNPVTTIAFSIPGSAGSLQHVSLAVYDSRGRRVVTLIDSPIAPGRHEITWRGRDEKGSAVPSGIYLSTLRVGGESVTRKMTILE